MRSFMMGSTLAGPVPIIVGGAVAVPMTYCFDIVVRGLHFSMLSLGAIEAVHSSWPLAFVVAHGKDGGVVLQHMITD